MKQRIVINGAENFVGRRLFARLAQSDWAQPVAVSTGNAAALQDVLSDAQSVVHCVVGSASMIRARSNALYTALAKRSAGTRIVHLSSSTVYGSAVGNVSEDGELRTDLGTYARAQRDAEGLATQHGNAVILRPGAEYGPECAHWSGRIAHLLRSRRLGDLGDAGDGVCNLTYIDDLIAAILAALEVEGIRGESFNIALDHKLTWNEYFVAFARALGAVPVKRISRRRLKLETKVLAVPLKLMEIVASRAGLHGLSLPPPISSSLLQSCAQDISLQVTKAERVLGVRWTPLEVGLKAAAEHYGRAAGI
jgi:nucleoside-diphosphate-sugar epimerase